MSHAAVLRFLWVSLAVTVLAACGSAPAVTSLAVDKATITTGQRARLTAVFSGGTGTISGLSAPVSSGEPIDSEPLTADTTFTLTVTGSDGQKTATAQVQVTVVAAPAISSFVAAAPLVVTGSGTTLTAVFVGGQGVVSGGVGAVESGVAAPTGPVSSAQTFSLTVTNAAGDSASSTVTVEARPAATITSFTAAKAIVTRGTATTLTAVYAQGSGAVDQGVGPVATGVVVPTGPLMQDTTFTLTVNGSVGPVATATVTVTVVDAPSIAGFSATPANITAGETSSLVATFSGGTASVDQAVGVVVSGQASTVSPAQSTTYTLTVTNAAMDSVTQTQVVGVVPAPTITSFTATQADLTTPSAPTLVPVFANGIASISGTGVSTITSGTPVTAPLLTVEAAATYTLTVTNSLGASVDRSVTVRAWAPASISTFTATPSTLTAGTSTQLAATFVGSCNIPGVGSGASPFSQAVSPQVTTTYTMTVSNPAGDSMSRSLTVTVVPAPVITSFTASAANFTTGAQPTLTAVFSGGTGTVTQGVGTVSSGVATTAPVLAAPGSVAYTLTVTNPIGAAVTRTIFVQAYPPASISAFSASPTHITQGTSTVVSGTFVGTGSLNIGGPVTSPFIRNQVLPGNTTFTLTVTNPAGSTASQSVAVTTVPLPVITSFTGQQLPAGDAGVVVTLPRLASMSLTGVFSGGTGFLRLRRLAPR